MRSFDFSNVTEALTTAGTSDHGITFVDRNLNHERLTWTQLADDSAVAAGAFIGNGVEAGDRVCLLSTTTPDLITALFGTWAAGAVPVILPLPRRLSESAEYLADILSRLVASGSKLLVYSSLFAADLPREIPVTAVPIENLQSGAPGKRKSKPEDLAYLQFTSGTTGNSRVVPLTHSHLLTNMAGAGCMVGIESTRDVLVSWLPLFHDMGLIGLLLGACFFGTELVLLPTEEFVGRPGSWLDAMSRYKGTITASPNFGYGLATRDLKAHPRALDLASWRLAANGAEAVDIHTIRSFTQSAEEYGFGPNSMCPMYGLAESTVAVSLASPEEPVHVEFFDRTMLETESTLKAANEDDPHSKGFVFCGHPIASTEVRIDGGEVGEILLKGPSIMQGYWNDDAATKDVLKDGWLHTGDIGFTGPHGLAICGRVKDMIVIGGRNLYPEDYELWTERVPGVRRGNVIAFSLPHAERMVVVAEASNHTDDSAEVAQNALEMLRTKLARGPEEVVLVAAGTLPKTSSGKRRRGICRDRYTAGELVTLAVAAR